MGVATAFIAQAFNIDLTLTDYLTVIFTATLAFGGHRANHGSRQAAGYNPEAASKEEKVNFDFAHQQK